MKNSDFTLGAFEADRTAPVLFAGVEVGRISRSFDWYAIKYSSGLQWGGGKTLAKALATFAYIYQTRQDARQDDPRNASEREQDAAAADWGEQVADLRASM